MADDDAFVQIGSDGGLLARPVRLQRLRIAPAERFDVVLDFGRYPVGTELTLVNELGTGTTRDVMRFRVTRRERDDARVPARLSQIEPLRRDQAVREREFRFRPIHVHLDPFQVLRDDDWDHGWKDTVDIQPTGHVEVLIRFADYAGKYVFHCHNLEHEDMMMANFATA